VIAVAGEALIDLIGDNGALRPHPGGGPFKTAVALGRLGVPVCFFGRLSNDRFGRLLEACLLESGVDGRYVLRGPAPTTLAVVHETADGDHEFAFYLAGTAYAEVTTADLPELSADIVAVSAGTLGLASDPPAGSIMELLERECQSRLIVVDPNVRPAVFGDRDAYLRRFEHCVNFAHVVKLSDADAQWLYPGVSVESVVDTVGAGDSFAAGLLRWLWVNNWLDAESVRTLDAAALTSALWFAASVGALQCSRSGATPPALAEVDAFLDRQ
jgi:fructokinase